MSDFTNIVVGGIYDGVFNTCYEQMDFLLDSRVQYNCGDQVCYAVFTTDGLDSNFCSCLLDNTENLAIIYQGSSNYAICGCIDGHPILGNVDRYSQLGACTVSNVGSSTGSTPSLSTNSATSSPSSSATNTNPVPSNTSTSPGGTSTGSSLTSSSRATNGGTSTPNTLPSSTSTVPVSSSATPGSSSTITDSSAPAPSSVSSSSTISVTVTPVSSISNSGTTPSGSTASVTSSKGNAAAALKPTSFNWKSEGMLYVASILLSTLALSLVE